MNREIYIADDGLKYCATCKEPVEQHIPENAQAILGMKKHSRQCKCIREQNAREEKERKEREHRRVVENNTSVCFEERMM